MKHRAALSSTLLSALALALGTAYAADTTSTTQPKSTDTMSNPSMQPSGGASDVKRPDVGNTDQSTAPTAQTSKSSDMSSKQAASDMGASKPKSASAAFKSLDAEHHGYLTKDEIQTQYPNIDFDKADRNHDGKLSKSEFTKAWKEANSGQKSKGAKASSSSDMGSPPTSGFTGGSTSTPSDSGTSSGASSSPSSSMPSSSGPSSGTQSQPSQPSSTNKSRY